MEEMKRKGNETTLSFKLSKCSSEGEKRRSGKNHIPEPDDDVIMEIFHRVPVENMYSLRGVCKKWLDLIDHPLFVNSNLARSEPCLLLQLCDDYKTRSRKTYFVEAPRSGDAVVVRSIDINPDFMISSSCNGLVVVSRGLEYFVINPSTMRSIRLPPFPKHCSLDCIRGVILGFDPQARQYKAMLNFCVEGQVHFAITTVGLSESWRVIRCGDKVYCPIHMQSVWANGAWHWLARSGKHVVSLDASKEMFFHVLLPCHLMKIVFLLRLVVYEDHLAVFECVPRVPLHPRQLDIWVLQDMYKCEWTKKHSFNMNSLEDQFIVQEKSMKKDQVRVTLLHVEENHKLDYLKGDTHVGGNPIAFLKNGKVALLKGYQVRYTQCGRSRAAYVREKRESLLAYNVERGEKCIVEGQELLPESMYPIHVFAHRKSLVTWNPTHSTAA
ncbi:putative F-box protein [Acorus calamus]|uniref:F-box protein n=1 Tax=Acorus calamus TaxID=4465 RepID=A0AAV9ENZ8_ACOCL|nr:putative F-box protein [Acorus calamus]